MMKRRLFISLAFLATVATALGKSVIRRRTTPQDYAFTKWIGQDGHGHYWWKYSYLPQLHPISPTQYARLKDKIRYP